jgi:hypothetical protein
MKFIQQPHLSFFLITVASLMLVSQSVSSNNPSQLPTPPNTGTPKGSPTPGTTRPQAVCPKTKKPLTALVANNNNDYTLSAYPTFWFYVPYASEQISSLEFILLDGLERETIYQADVKLTDKPGIIKVTLPSQESYALKVQENYRWYLMLNCKPHNSEEPDLVVNGWIQRVKATQSPENSIWYDKINNAAQAYFTNPDSQESNQVWNDILKTLGYQWIIQEPLVDSSLDSH